MAWRPAKSLQTLKNQLDSDYPGWAFLGFLGDQAHASVPSDHNPNSAGVVTALDIGPGGGLDIHALADRLAANPHPDLKYIISNGRIAEWQNDFQWRPYGGSDPHDTHIHVSVGRGPDGQSVQPYDDDVKWSIGDNNVKPYREGIIAAYQDFLDINPTEQQIKDQMGQEDMRNVYDSLRREVRAKREDMYREIAALKKDATVLTSGKYLVK